MPVRFRKVVCICNPVAGAGASSDVVSDVRRSLRNGAERVELAPTEGPGHASALAREAVRADADLVAVLGGDGTANEVVQGLAGIESASLLVLPGGTANVLVNEVGMPRDPAKAAAMLPRLERRMVRLGRVQFDVGGSRYFLLMCGAGLDAEISSRTSTSLKNRWGQGAFWLQGMGQALRPCPQLRIDGEGLHGSKALCLVVISKSRRYGGGLVFCPLANLLADQLEVVGFSGSNPIHHWAYFLAIALQASDWIPGIARDMRSDLRLVPAGSRSVKLQVDGEVAGELPARVSLSSVFLHVMLPPEYGEAGLASRHEA